MGFMLTGTPAGQGMLDVRWLMGRLREHGREFNAILELWPPLEPDMAATIRKEADWAAASVGYLRGLIPD
jgi:hypothetical protein